MYIQFIKGLIKKIVKNYILRTLRLVKIVQFNIIIFIFSGKNIANFTIFRSTSNKNNSIFEKRSSES